MDTERRIAIVAGLRTPFIKSGTLFKDLSALDLGKMAVVEILNRTEIDPDEIDKIIIGNVLPTIKTSNLAREIALGAGIPARVPAFTVTSACASANQAFTDGVDSIMSGNAEVVLVGGTESVSDFPVLFSKKFRAMLFESNKGKNVIQRARPFLNMGIGDMSPDVPSISERSTGLTLGESADKMARLNNISRNDQDEMALRSHNNAVRALEENILDHSVFSVFVPPEFLEPVSLDNNVKADLTIEHFKSFEPVFDKKYGTVTAGNTAPLSDGAALLLLMSREKARALGYNPLAYVRSYAFAAVDPGAELLMAPAYSTPKALTKAGLSLADINIVELHEAFAAQALSNIKVLGSKSFAEEKLGLSGAVGEIDVDNLNTLGGSIAVGHTFGATGGRVLISLLDAMRAKNAEFGLASVCAAGGLGVSVVLERD